MQRDQLHICDLHVRCTEAIYTWAHAPDPDAAVAHVEPSTGISDPGTAWGLVTSSEHIAESSRQVLARW